MFRIIGCYFIGGIYADTGDLDEASLIPKRSKGGLSSRLENMRVRLINAIAGVHEAQELRSCIGTLSEGTGIMRYDH
jgi:hypothetical protein